jgi:hypothetical protein
MEIALNWFPNMCLFFHKWGKWTIYRNGNIKHCGRVTGTHIEQERMCERCGLRQYKSTDMEIDD